MSWFVFAILAAIFDALRNVCSKRSLTHIDGYIVSFSLAVVTFMLFLLGVSILEIPDMRSPALWLTLLLNGALESASIVCYLSAIQHSELSLTIPILSFTPIFLLVTAPFLVGDYPTRFDIVGVLCIVAGTYVLYAQESHHGFFGPLRALVHAKGSRLMLLVAVLYTFLPEVNKLGARQSSPCFGCWPVRGSLRYCC